MVLRKVAYHFAYLGKGARHGIATFENGSKYLAMRLHTLKQLRDPDPGRAIVIMVRRMYGKPHGCPCIRRLALTALVAGFS